MFTFDTSIRMGDVIQIVAFLIVGIGAFYGVKAKLAEVVQNQVHMSKIYDLRLSYIDATLEDAKNELKTSQSQDNQIAQHRIEIDKLWKIIDELRHWKGFVNPSGEYRRDATPPQLIDPR